MKSNLKVLLAKKELTQKELANILHLDIKFINRLATGKVKAVAIENLKKLSEFFDNCPIEELLYFEYVA